MISLVLNELKKRKKLAKFLIVGGSGTLVNMFFLWILKDIIGLSLAGAGIIAIEISVMGNFILNNFWTFNSKFFTSHWAVRFLKYQISVLIGIGINYAVLIILTQYFNVFYLISNLIGIALATMSNYLLSSRWAWKN
jgi:dolichol-phosphate mannosyltransferase